MTPLDGAVRGEGAEKCTSQGVGTSKGNVDEGTHETGEGQEHEEYCNDAKVSEVSPFVIKM